MQCDIFDTEVRRKGAALQGKSALEWYASGSQGLGSISYNIHSVFTCRYVTVNANKWVIRRLKSM